MLVATLAVVARTVRFTGFSEKVLPPPRAPGNSFTLYRPFSARCDRTVPTSPLYCDPERRGVGGGGCAVVSSQNVVGATCLRNGTRKGEEMGQGTAA